MKGSARTVLAALLIAAPLRLAAGEHPVPLDPKTDSAKCLECHEDKGKGPHVHSAIAIGCTSCHEIRVTKSTTRVKLTTTTTGKLCLSCHADKNAADIHGRVHPPAVRDCVKCHDPHQSANAAQLLKPVSGGKEANLCLSCHATGLGVTDKGSRHAALDMGCDTCHTVHKSGDPTKPEFANHLAKSAPQLCLDCHDPKEDSLRKAHDNQPFATADCLQCHDPHQSSRPKLMQAFVHVPFEGGNSSCNSCHQPAKDGKVTLTQASAKELCVTCHSDKAEQIEKAKVPHPGALGECTDCHNPHAGKSPGFPKPDAVNACLSCHAEQAQLRTKKHLHQPAFEQGCATCHTPHGGANAHLLRAANTNTLCLECHGPDSNPAKLEGEHLLALFDGAVKVPENYFAKVPVLPVKYNAGHPTDRHPVTDAMDLKTRTMVPITCLTCHQAHAGNEAGMLVKDQAANMAFCRTCHQEGTLQGVQKR
jgi:predicted CXXCH cytochrome family protein